MDKSLSNFELNDSTINIATDSENGSDKSDHLIDVEYPSSTNGSSNGNKSDDADFDNNLPETVTLLRYEPTGAKVYLIGTAHFSKESQEDVIKVIRNVQPNIVVLELCSSRTNILALDEETILEEAKNINMQKIMGIIRSNGVYNGVMYLLLLNMSAQLTKQLGMAPGGEFRVAYKEASKIANCTINLGDRPIWITLKRALSRLTWFQTIKLAWYMITTKDTVSAEDIEKFKNRDMLEHLLAEMAGEYPSFNEVFLDERNIFLTNSLQSAAYSKLKAKNGAGEAPIEPLKVVGIVGIGHVPGIVKLWPQEQKSYVNEILKVPPPSLTSIAIKYTFKISLLVAGGYLVYKYVPVPKFLRENVHLAAQKLIANVKTTSTDIKYALN